MEGKHKDDAPSAGDTGGAGRRAGRDRAVTVVYLDSVFVCNALADYFLMLLTARLAGIPLRRGRYALSGVLGGLYALAVFLPGGGFLAAGGMKAAAGLVLCAAAFWGQPHFLRLALLAFAVACGLAGAVLALGTVTGRPIPSAGGVFYTDIDAGTLLLSATAAYLFLSVVFRASASQGLRGRRMKVTVCLLGRRVRLTALRDTGNGLVDPAGRPVLVVHSGCFPQLPHDLLALPPDEALPALRRRCPALCPQLLTLRTALGQGLVVAVRCDWAEIDGQRRPGLTAALVTQALGDGCSALWGGEGGERYREAMAQEAALALGTCPDGTGALHRGQRHLAPAPEKGAGGGAAGAPGHAGGPAGDH